MLVATLALLCLAAAPPPLVEVRNAADPARRIEARASLDSGEIRLSGEVKLTLTVEGPGPLGVTPPRPLLTAANQWRIREDGLPLREVLAGGRERWTHAYRLAPLVRGKPTIALGSLTVRPGGEQDVVIDWHDQALAVRVETSIENPSADSLRPATDIEQLPPAPPPGRKGAPWLFAVVPGLLLAAAAALMLARRKRRPPAPRNAVWAAHELSAAGLTADRCAVVLRQYLAFRFGLPAEARTTPELTSALRADDRLPAECLAEWQALLDECDAARFSGTAAAVGGLADRARALVAGAEAQREDGREDAQNDTSS